MLEGEHIEIGGAPFSCVQSAHRQHPRGEHSLVCAFCKGENEHSVLGEFANIACNYAHSCKNGLSKTLCINECTFSE